MDHGQHSGMWVPGEPPTWGRMFLPHLEPVSVLARRSASSRCWSTSAPSCGCAAPASRWPWWRTLAWVGGTASLFAVTGTWFNGYRWCCSACT